MKPRKKGCKRPCSPNSPSLRDTVNQYFISGGWALHFEPWKTMSNAYIQQDYSLEIQGAEAHSHHSKTENSDSEKTIWPPFFKQRQKFGFQQCRLSQFLLISWSPTPIHGASSLHFCVCLWRLSVGMWDGNNETNACSKN